MLIKLRHMHKSPFLLKSSYTKGGQNSAYSPYVATRTTLERLKERSTLSWLTEPIRMELRL